MRIGWSRHDPSIVSVSATVPFNDLGRQHREMAPAIETATARVLASGWYVMGPELEAFEVEFAQWCGVAGCVGVANGTDALELALRGVGVQPGDEVVTVANAGGYTSIACAAIGAIPRYVDVDDATLGISPAAVASVVNARTAAVVVTHLYGIVADVAGVRSVVPAGVAVVEDGSQAHGARAAAGRVGSLADAGAFSFYPTKNLGAAGDAGAVVSDRADVLDRVRRLRQYGWAERNVASLAGGRNSRLDELQAAVLREKLARVDGWNERRRSIAARWREALGTHLTFVQADGRDDVAHLCVARHPRRDLIHVALAREGVATAIHFACPDHRQPAFSSLAPPADLPVTERSCREVLSLPCFPQLGVDELAFALRASGEVLGRLG